MPLRYIGWILLMGKRCVVTTIWIQAWGEWTPVLPYLFSGQSLKADSHMCTRRDTNAHTPKRYEKVGAYIDISRESLQIFCFPGFWYNIFFLLNCFISNDIAVIPCLLCLKWLLSDSRFLYHSFNLYVVPPWACIKSKFSMLENPPEVILFSV